METSRTCCAARAGPALAPPRRATAPRPKERAPDRRDRVAGRGGRSRQPSCARPRIVSGRERVPQAPSKVIDPHRALRAVRRGKLEPDLGGINAGDFNEGAKAANTVSRNLLDGWSQTSDRGVISRTR